MSYAYLYNALFLYPSFLKSNLLFVPKIKIPLFSLFFGLEQKQSENLVEKMDRMRTENKKLTQMLKSMCENYNVLQSQLVNLLSQTPKAENRDDYLKKRKACFEAIDGEDIQGSSEHSCISYEDSCKRARLLSSKPKVSKIFVRTEKSDTKLVCMLELINL